MNHAEVRPLPAILDMSLFKMTVSSASGLDRNLNKINKMII